MLTTPLTRPVGGDFEPVSSELLREGPVLPPWESRHGTAITYPESGRQALAAVEEVLRREGRGRLILPAFFCDSMVLPFTRQGWQIIPVPIGRNLFPLPSAVTSELTSPHDTAVLHVPYFGQEAPPHLAEELADARRAGARLVMDETHRPFAASGVDVDFCVASLRKTLALVDGAYVTGLDARLEPQDFGDSGALSRIRAEAMASKGLHLAGAREPDRHLTLFRQADELAADRLDGAAMSSVSRDLLRRLDYAEIVRRRRSNAVHLATALRELGVRLLADPHESAAPPSHLVVEVARPQVMQAALAAHGVYCSIHWPRPTLVAVESWSDRLLSIPIDQRYDAADMARIARTIGGLSGEIYRLPDTEAH